MQPLHEGPLGPLRLENVKAEDFPSYQAWAERYRLSHPLPALPDKFNLEFDPDSREDLIHPFID